MREIVCRLLADAVVLAHAAFIVFVALGGLLVLRWRGLAWVHVPCVAWGALVELAGWVCPLTPLEIWLRRRSGAAGYDADFIDHYIIPILYPAGLTRRMQIVLGAAALGVNLLIYGLLLWRTWRRDG